MPDQRQSVEAEEAFAASMALRRRHKNSFRLTNERLRSLPRYASAQTWQTHPETNASLYELSGRSSDESSLSLFIASPPFTSSDDSSDVSFIASAPITSNDEKIVPGVADPTCASAVPTPDVSSSDEYSGYSSEESISSSPRIVPHDTTGASPHSVTSLGTNILTQTYVNCYQGFYIRMDRAGLFLTYPDVGGPFQSVEEAKHATRKFFDELWRAHECKKLDEISHDEGMINDRKYYLRGPPKRTSSPSNNTTYDERKYLIIALLDQFNDDNNLVGNRAHELEEVSWMQLIYENHIWYYHFNFTTKQKEDDNGNPSNAKFFAELSHIQGEKAWEVNCCCIIDCEPNGVICQGCINNGSPSMMHPSDPGAYVGGRLNGYLPFGCVDWSGSDDDEVLPLQVEEDEEEEEEEEEEDEDEVDKEFWSWFYTTNEFATSKGLEVSLA